MNMPKMKPLPIPTKDVPIYTRIWRWITSVREWEIIQDWEHPLPGDRPIIIVPKGFQFDGASIPRVLWGILSPTGLLLIPGLVHDFGYRYNYIWAIDEEGYAYKYTLKEGRKGWDELFKKVGLDVNGFAVIDRLAWLAVALFGSWAWNSNREKNAPELKPSRPIRPEAPADNENIDLAATG